MRHLISRLLTKLRIRAQRKRDRRLSPSAQRRRNIRLDGLDLRLCPFNGCVRDQNHMPVFKGGKR